MQTSVYVSYFLHMKRKSSPVLRSVKCSIKSSQRHANNDTRCNLKDISNKTVDHQLASSSFDFSFSSISKSNTQESNLTTQGSQLFKARLEKKISRIQTSSEDVIKPNKLDISLNYCSPSNVDIGPFYGLPTKVRDLMFQNRHIKGLYDWQDQCLNSALGNDNLLISLPTSSGKTLVAEILMLRKLLLYQKNCLFVLPFISLVQEKVRGLCSLAVDLNFIVEEYAASKGFYPPKIRKKRNTIYVATIEKANSLIGSLLEEKRINEIGLVVVDEVHMITETGGRGARLEAIITKLKHFAENVQLVSMSATVGNLKELATFLKAKLYKGGFRPVPLTQYVKMGDETSVINPKAISEDDLFEPCSLTFSHTSEEHCKVDPDMITPLVEEIIPKHSCLVFCATKKNTEAVAKMMCSCLPKSLLEWKNIAKISLMKALKEEGNGILCPVLRKTVPFGVGYHHSGLTDGERKLLEEAFLIGSLCCIVCTSTLAAGVNLPARRVIIRAPYIGKDFLTSARYHQMIGRAGRAGLDSVGESFLVIIPRDICRFQELLLSQNEHCISRMSENDAKGLTELIFSMIGMQTVKSVSSILSLVSETLLAIQAEALEFHLNSEVMNIIKKLRSQGFIRSNKDSHQELKKSPEDLIKTKYSLSISPSEECNLNKNDQLIICRVGKAAVKGSIDLQWANRLYYDLVNARGSLAVHSHLHLLYLITPYEASESFVCNPEVFFNVHNRLTKEELEIGYLIGITDAVAVQIKIGIRPKHLDELVVKRFYVALLLHKLLGGKNIWSVSDSFQVHRGMIQQLLSSTISFAHSVLYFCEELQELWAFRDLLSTFTKTLSICSFSEISPLMSLPSVKFGRAKLLYNAGYKNLSQIAKATPQQLVKQVEHLPSNVARQLISSAKMMLLEKANSLQEEAEEMLLDLVSD